MRASKLILAASVAASLVVACGDDDSLAKQTAANEQGKQQGAASQTSDASAVDRAAVDAATGTADGGVAANAQDAGLTCEQQSANSSIELAAARASADTHCSVDDDCTTAYFATDCFKSCGGIVSKVGAAQVAQATTAPVSTACDGFHERGCVAVAPPCVSAPSFACVSGTCTGFALDARAFSFVGPPTIDDGFANQTIALAVGQQLELTLHTTGPGNYLDPQLSSAVLSFVGSSFPTAQNPGGPTQLYTFDVVSAGDVELTIPHSTKPQPFKLTVVVR